MNDDRGKVDDCFQIISGVKVIGLEEFNNTVYQGGCADIKGACHDEANGIMEVIIM